jgi:hypothetical protein
MWLLRNVLSCGHNTRSSVKASNSQQNIDIPFRLQEIINLFDIHGCTVCVIQTSNAQFWYSQNKYNSYGWWYVTTDNIFTIYYNKCMQMKRILRYTEARKSWYPHTSLKLWFIVWSCTLLLSLSSSWIMKHMVCSDLLKGMLTLLILSYPSYV